MSCREGTGDIYQCIFLVVLDLRQPDSPKTDMGYTVPRTHCIFRKKNSFEVAFALNSHILGTQQEGSLKKKARTSQERIKVGDRMEREGEEKSKYINKTLLICLFLVINIEEKLSLMCCFLDDFCHKFLRE